MLVAKLLSTEPSNIELSVIESLLFIKLDNNTSNSEILSKSIFSLSEFSSISSTTLFKASSKDFLSTTTSFSNAPSFISLLSIEAVDFFVVLLIVLSLNSLLKRSLKV